MLLLIIFVLYTTHLYKFSLANSYSNFIINGVPARQKQFPFQVSILKTSQNSSFHWCGGSILSTSWIVTAAHCFDPKKPQKPQNYKIVVGSIYFTHGGKEHELEKVIIYPEYRNMSHDIALLKVTTEIEFDMNTQPIRIKNGVVKPGTVAKISGW